MDNKVEFTDLFRNFDKQHDLVNVKTVNDGQLYCWKVKAYNDVELILGNNGESISIQVKSIESIKIIHQPKPCKSCGKFSKYGLVEGLCGACRTKDNKPTSKTKETLKGVVVVESTLEI